LSANGSYAPPEANIQVVAHFRLVLGRKLTVRFWNELARKVPFRWRPHAGRNDLAGRFPKAALQRFLPMQASGQTAFVSGFNLVSFL